MAEPLPDGLARLVADLQRMGFAVSNDESQGWIFRKVTLLHPGRSFGNTVRITQEHGLWEVEISIEGVGFHGPYDVLRALDGRAFERRLLSHEETLAATLEALGRMPDSEAEMETLRVRLQTYREDHIRRWSGRDRHREEARRLFNAGDFRAALDVYERLCDDELTRADRMRVRIARDRSEAL
jgi:hypothetical protein